MMEIQTQVSEILFGGDYEFDNRVEVLLKTTFRSQQKEELLDNNILSSMSRNYREYQKNNGDSVKYLIKDDVINLYNDMIKKGFWKVS